MNPQSSILVGTINRTVLVRVEGKGSFLNSTGLKDFAREMVNRGFRDFVFDLLRCPVMDSTFMGTMAGIALRLRELGQGRVSVVKLNERNHDLLTNLGFDRLFCLSQEPAPALPDTAPKAIETAAPDKIAQAKTMLEAHEACVEANPDNAAKFKDVLEYLKQDLQRGAVSRRPPGRSYDVGCLLLHSLRGDGGRFLPYLSSAGSGWS